jgi:hypothetical protein
MPKLIKVSCALQTDPRLIPCIVGVYRMDKWPMDVHKHRTGEFVSGIPGVNGAFYLTKTKREMENKIARDLELQEKETNND